MYSSVFVHESDYDEFLSIFKALTQCQIVKSLHMPNTIMVNISEFATGNFEECDNEGCNEQIPMLYQYVAFYNAASEFHGNAKKLGFKYCSSDDRFFCSKCMDLAQPCHCTKKKHCKSNTLFFRNDFGKCSECNENLSPCHFCECGCAWIIQCDFEECKDKKICSDCAIISQCSVRGCNLCACSDHLAIDEYDNEYLVCQKCYDPETIKCSNCSNECTQNYAREEILFDEDGDNCFVKCGFNDNKCENYLCCACKEDRNKNGYKIANYMGETNDLTFVYGCSHHRNEYHKIYKQLSTLMQRANDALAKQECKQALRTYERALSCELVDNNLELNKKIILGQNPKYKSNLHKLFLDVLNNLSAIYMQRRQWKQCEKFASLVLAHDKFNKQALLRIAIALRKMKKYDRAIFYLQRTHASNNKNNKLDMRIITEFKLMKKDKIKISLRPIIMNDKGKLWRDICESKQDKYFNKILQSFNDFTTARPIYSHPKYGNLNWNHVPYHLLKEDGQLRIRIAI